MQGLFFTAKAISPLFIMVAAGVILKICLKLTQPQVRIINKICFYLLMPCTLFKGAVTYDLSSITNLWPYLYGAATILLSCVLLILIAPHLIHKPIDCSAFIHAAWRPNAVLLGIPLTIHLFGEANAIPMSLMAMGLSPLFNVLGVISVDAVSDGKSKISVWQIAKNILTNPLIVAMVFGFVLNGLHIKIPELLMDPISDLGNTATPIAMLVIGMSFELNSVQENLKLILLASGIKTMLIPAVFTAIAIYLGFRGPELIAIYMVNAVPTAINCSIITEEMGGNGRLASEATLASTALSAITIIIGVTLLNSMGVL